jgi:serine/threonine protein kinase/WD40 repeat protein
MEESTDEGQTWLDKVASRFDKAWRAGGQPRIEDFLTDAEGRRRAELFAQLLSMERQRRAARGEQALSEDYRIRFPEYSILIDKVFEITLSTHPISEQLGSRIGPYRLLKELARGGMGVVYLAEQDSGLQREVALKIIIPERNHDAAVARFTFEMKALASMRHPNIAEVYDDGTTDRGHLYFVMEYITGSKITDYCDDNQLTIRERLQVFVLVCRAIQHAHNKGIIHRDVKPSNILVHMIDGKPVPKVIDFGVAIATNRSLTDRSLPFEFGSPVGTLLYMSPEQTDSNPGNIDIRTDIYSLGVLLYELLTGTTPLRQTVAAEARKNDTLHRIRTEEFPSPSVRLSENREILPSISSKRKTRSAKLLDIMRGELDSVVMKTLEKNPGNRYETVSEFANDLNRYLNNETLHALPPSWAYTVRKYIKRNRSHLISASVFTIALVLGTALTFWFRHKAIDADNTARRAIVSEAAEKENANVNAESARVALQKVGLIRKTAESHRLSIASDHERSKHLDLSLLLAVEAFRTQDTLEARNSLRRALSSQPGILTHLYPRSRGHFSHVLLSPDGRTLAAADIGDDLNERGIELWDVPSHAHLTANPLPVSEGRVKHMAFSPDGKTLTAIFGTFRGDDASAAGGAVLWDMTNRKRVSQPAIHLDKGDIWSTILSDDGRLLAANGRTTVELWDVANNKCLTDGPIAIEDASVQAGAFSPDGKIIALFKQTQESSGVHRNGIMLWDIAKQHFLRDEPIAVKDGSITCLAYTSDSNVLALAYRDVDVADPFEREIKGAGSVILWDTTQQSRLTKDPLRVENGVISRLTFAPDGKALAAVYNQLGMNAGTGGVMLWDMTNQKRVTSTPLPVNEGSVTNVTFSPDGKMLVARYDWGRNHGVVLWDLVTKGRVTGPLLDDESYALTEAFNPDGTTLIVGMGNRILLWDVSKQSRLADTPFESLAEELFPHEKDEVRQATLRGMALSPDRKTAAVSYGLIHDQRVAFLDVESRTRLNIGMLEFNAPINDMAFLNDRRSLICSVQGSLTRHDLNDSGFLGKQLNITRDVNIPYIAVSPYGDTIALGYTTWDNDISAGRVVLWNTANRTSLTPTPLELGEGGISGLAFSPDGRTLGTGYWRRGKDGEGGAGGLVLWDVAKRERTTKNAIARKEGKDHEVRLAFSPDSKSIAVAYSGMFESEPLSEVTLWEVASHSQVASYAFPMKSGWVLDLAFSPDGKLLATGGGGVVVWYVESRDLVASDAFVLKGDLIRNLSFSRDSKNILAGRDCHSDIGGVVFWDLDLESWQRRARQIVNRNLTREEWRQHFPKVPYRETFPGLPSAPE